MGCLPRRLTDTLPDLPAGFLDWVKETGRKIVTLADLVVALKEWKKRPS